MKALNSIAKSAFLWIPKYNSIMKTKQFFISVSKGDVQRITLVHSFSSLFIVLTRLHLHPIFCFKPWVYSFSLVYYLRNQLPAPLNKPNRRVKRNSDLTTCLRLADNSKHRAHWSPALNSNSRYRCISSRASKLIQVSKYPSVMLKV